jgi:putative proteasome-type protease
VTYCVAASVNEGLIFVSDSRTNAGVDQISTFSKMHAFCGNGERFFVLLSSGNLATTQAVVTRLRHDLRNAAAENLTTLQSMSAVAEYVGRVSVEQQSKHRSHKDQNDFAPEASFVLGGQIAGTPPRLFLIYPEGNFVHATKQTPFLQIGETKYGKPILDRILTADTTLETAARCAIVSIDSTMRSNATVGPPIEVLLYPANTMRQGAYLRLDEDHEYLKAIREAWAVNLRQAFDQLPRLATSTASLRLVDG